MLTKTRHQPLSAIAAEVLENWRYHRRDYPCARPYAEAMLDMDQVSGGCGLDTGRSVVLYFLANAQGWRGPTARDVKARLRRILNGVD